MLSLVKRKQKLLLTLTLTALITGSILAFSIQAAYSVADYNSSRSNTSTAINQIEKVLDELKAYAKISGDANMISSIEILSMDLQQVKQGLVEMDKFFFALETEMIAMDLAAEPTRQTAEPTTKKGAYSNITLERGFSVAEGIDMYVEIGVVPGETALQDRWVIVVDKSILGDEMSDELIEYLKVTLSDARIASIMVSQDEAKLSVPFYDKDLPVKDVAPGLQPEVIKPKVPEWVRNNAGWYAEGLIPEGDFVRGLEWMINNGIIQIDPVGIGIGEEGVN